MGPAATTGGGVRGEAPGERRRGFAPPERKGVAAGSWRSRAALLALLWLTAVNCRAPILGVGPILPRIIEDLGLSHTTAGFLFSAPVLMMGLLGLPGGLLADRLGAGRVMGAGLAAIAVTSALRAVGGAVGLFGGSVLLGAAIGALQPAIPRVVRGVFPDRIGFATAIYSTGFTAGALTGVLAPGAWLLPAVGDAGWRSTFFVWSGLAAVVALGWPRFRGAGARSADAPDDAGVYRVVLRDPLLWLVALLQSLNSAVFFAANAWLTPYYLTLGWPPARAAAPLAVLTAVGGAAAFVVPTISDRMRARRPALLVTCALTVGGAIGFVAAPVGLVWLACLVFGVGLFGSWTINLALPVDVCVPARVGAATGLAFSMGHGGALIGPVLAGLLFDLTGDFRASMVSIAGIALVMTLLALAVPETYGRKPT